MKLSEKIVKVFDYTIDTYFAYPILIDIILSIVLWMTLKYSSNSSFKLTDRVNQITLFPYIISADVSLAGFILAALTIIVTFKSNLKARGIQEATDALELIFSSKHYASIIKVFKKSLIEFVLCFIFIFIIWSLSDNLSIKTIFRINATGILLTSFAIIRSLYILFVVLDLDKHKRPD